MTIAREFLIEFDEEMKMTRRMLERVPDAVLDYKPHPKSMSMRELASHIADMPGWGAVTVESDELDLQPPEGPAYEVYLGESRDGILGAFDRNVVKAKAAISPVSNEEMLTDWTLLMHARPIFTMPRISVLKSMTLNHIIHHRAQLGVYLRLNDVPIPGMYGPSADDLEAG